LIWNPSGGSSFGVIYTGTPNTGFGYIPIGCVTVVTASFGGASGITVWTGDPYNFTTLAFTGLGDGSSGPVINNSGGQYPNGAEFSTIRIGNYSSGTVSGTFQDTSPILGGMDIGGVAGNFGYIPANPLTGWAGGYVGASCRRGKYSIAYGFNTTGLGSPLSPAYSIGIASGVWTAQPSFAFPMMVIDVNNAPGGWVKTSSGKIQAAFHRCVPSGYPPSRSPNYVFVPEPDGTTDRMWQGPLWNSTPSYFGQNLSLADLISQGGNYLPWPPGVMGFQETACNCDLVFGLITAFNLWPGTIFGTNLNGWNPTAAICINTSLTPTTYAANTVLATQTITVTKIG
jgi:hypothetical protein